MKYAVPLLYIFIYISDLYWNSCWVMKYADLSVPLLYILLAEDTLRVSARPAAQAPWRILWLICTISCSNFFFFVELFCYIFCFCKFLSLFFLNIFFEHFPDFLNILEIFYFWKCFIYFLSFFEILFNCFLIFWIFLRFLLKFFIFLNIFEIFLLLFF